MKSKKKSVINIQNNGINNAKRLLVKLKPVNGAILLLGQNLVDVVKSC